MINKSQGQCFDKIGLFFSRLILNLKAQMENYEGQVKCIELHVLTKYFVIKNYCYKSIDNKTRQSVNLFGYRFNSGP